MLQVQTLRQICVEQIIDSMTVEAVLTYAVTADSLSDATLLEACLAFITNPSNRYGKLNYATAATFDVVRKSLIGSASKDLISDKASFALMQH